MSTRWLRVGDSHHFDCFPELIYSQIILARIRIANGEIEVESQVQGLDLQRTLKLSQSLLVAPYYKYDKYKPHHW